MPTMYVLYDIGATTAYDVPNESMHLMLRLDDGTLGGVTLRQTPALIAKWFQENLYALSDSIEYRGVTMSVNMFVTIYSK